jgi:hypothetical protein
MHIVSNTTPIAPRPGPFGAAALRQRVHVGVASYLHRAGVPLTLAAGLILAGCSGSMPSFLGTSSSGSSSSSSSSSPSSAEGLLGLNNMSSASGQGQRDLTPPEKKIISDAVALMVKDGAAAQFRWPKVSAVEEGSLNYCGMVNAKSQYPAYSGWQAYIVEAQVSGGKISSAVVGLIAGGKDVEIVRKMCKKYDLDPGTSG